MRLVILLIVVILGSEQSLEGNASHLESDTFNSSLHQAVILPETPPFQAINENNEGTTTIKPKAIKYSNQDEDEVQDLQDRRTIIKKPVESTGYFGNCFHASPDVCEFENFHANSKNCSCKPHDTIKDTIICCNVTNVNASKLCYEQNWGHLNKNGTQMQIHIQNATLRELDLSYPWWKKFNKISITNGKIRKLTRFFQMHTKLQCLNVSHNQLNEINTRAFQKVQNFTVLDISFNNLTEIPNVNHTMNLTINIQGNYVLCRRVQEAIDAGLKFFDPDQSYCMENHTFHWFNSTDSVPLSQLYKMKDLRNECPDRCTCGVERLNFESLDPKNSNSQLVFSAKVDCSNLGLLELPEKLPADTYSLNVSNNNITSLELINNPSYHHLIRLYADNNQISTLLDLEGTNFIEQFEVFFMRRNNLKTIPIYLLSNTLDKNPRGRMLYLEGNRLTCDCSAAKDLRMWLLGHQNHIKDFDKILCENVPNVVVDLSETKFCPSHQDWTDYIYYLIGAEVFLLLALISKVSYDFWLFKTAGYLPWPASKMPKLPCESLCV